MKTKNFFSISWNECAFELCMNGISVFYCLLIESNTHTERLTKMNEKFREETKWCRLIRLECRLLMVIITTSVIMRQV